MSFLKECFTYEVLRSVQITPCLLLRLQRAVYVTGTHDADSSFWARFDRGCCRFVGYNGYLDYFFLSDGICNDLVATKSTSTYISIGAARPSSRREPASISTSLVYSIFLLGK